MTVMLALSPCRESRSGEVEIVWDRGFEVDIPWSAMNEMLAR